MATSTAPATSDVSYKFAVDKNGNVTDILVDRLANIPHARAALVGRDIDNAIFALRLTEFFEEKTMALLMQIAANNGVKFNKTFLMCEEAKKADTLPELLGTSMFEAKLMRVLMDQSRHSDAIALNIVNNYFIGELHEVGQPTARDIVDAGDTNVETILKGTIVKILNNYLTAHVSRFLNVDQLASELGPSCIIVHGGYSYIIVANIIAFFERLKKS